MNARLQPSRFVLLGTLSLLFGCASELTPGSEVSSFRVLAVQAETPYARPGETVHLTSLSHDPDGRPVTWAWASCLNPDSSSVEGCLGEVARHAGDAGGLPLVAFGEGATEIDLPVPADALDGIAPTARPLALTGVVSVACPGELEVLTDGRIPFRCTETGTGRELHLDEYVVGVKRVMLRQSDRNQNPVIERVLFDGVEWPEDEIKDVGSCSTSGHVYDDCSGRDKHRIQAVLTPESFESGTDEFGRGFSEAVIVQHYATEGIFEDEIRIGSDSENGWVARRSASGQEVVLWLVARDDRGGVSWAERRVRVQ